MLTSNDMKTLSHNDATQTKEMLAMLMSQKLLKFALVLYV